MNLAKNLLVSLGFMILSLNTYAIDKNTNIKIDKSSEIKLSNDKNSSNRNYKTDKKDNVLKEYGPLTICADRATYDTKKQTLTYYGNVFVMQIHNKHILCKKPEINIKGVIYFARDKHLTFSQLQKKWLKQAKGLCASEDECNFISGQKLIMKLNDSGNIKTLTMATKSDEKSQFYNLPTKSDANKTTSKGPINGEAKEIVYDVVNKTLELHNNAILDQDDNDYKGSEITYDMRDGLIYTPGSLHKRSKLVLEGIEEKTKIHTGLKPISQYNKDDADAPTSTPMIDNDVSNPSSSDSSSNTQGGIE